MAFTARSDFQSQRASKNVRPIVGCELTMEDGSVLPVLVENEGRL